MAEADPQLLSLLEKTANPLQNVNVQIKLNGVFSPPQQWKITDQANPNIFTYTLQLLGQEYVKGKIEPRKLTEKELREQEEKSKKGAKKQAKQEQKVPQVDPEEQARLQREWDALSEEQKLHRTSQDPFKAFSLKFGESTKQMALDKDAIVKLETDIEGQSVEVVLIRKPDMSEEQIQKLKKSKPKTLNIGELYPAAYKGKINLKELTKPGVTKFLERIKISFAGELPDECIKIQADGCYVYVEITTSEPMTPEVKQIKPETSEVLPEFNPEKKQNFDIIPLLKLEICRTIKALSQQYFGHFLKEKDHHEDKRHTNLSNISTLRLNEINKKKQIFLNQFMNSPKFGVIKDRIGKVIKAAVIDKFRKEKSRGPILKQHINSTLSEINLYFQEQLIKTIDEFMVQENSSVHEDLVLGYENSRQNRKQTISPIVSETEEERQMRLAKEFQILHMHEKAEQNYINILILSENSLAAREGYAKFCLRNKKFDEAYVIFKEIAEESQKLQYKLIQALLLVNRRRVVESSQLISAMIESNESTLQDKIVYNLLLSFMYEREQDIKQSEKYLAIAERYYKMKQNPHLKFHPTMDPYELPKAKVPKPQRYTSQLTHSESQQIRLNFISLLTEFNLFNLISQYIPKLDESQKKSILQIEVEIFKNQYDRAIQKIEALLKKADNIRNIDLLMTRADVCYLSDKMFQSEEIFLTILQLKPNPSKILQVYLKLGNTYLNRKSWEDAKMVFQKACEQKFNCSMAWLGLGIAKLNLGMHSQAEQALNLSKIYNPLSDQTAIYQVEIDEHYRQSSLMAYKYASEDPVS